MKILWTELANFQLKEIHKFISRDSTYYVNIFAVNVKKSVLRLNQFPYSGRIVPEIENENIREIFYMSYRIMYEIRENFVYIMQIIHGAIDFKSEED